MIGRKTFFGGALALALVAFLPLRVVAGSLDGAVSAHSVEGSIWSGRLVGAGLAGQRIGDLKAGLSPLHLFVGQLRVGLDGAMRGAIISSFGGKGADIETATVPLGRAVGPVRLASMDLNDAHVRFRGRDCAEAEGRITVLLEGALGNQRLSGSFRCSGAALGAELLSQSAMQRLTLRFARADRYEAILTARATSKEEAALLTGAGFREGASGHMLRFSGAL